MSESDQIENSLGEGEESALLIDIYSGAAQRVKCDEYLDELESLAQTFGIKCADKIACPVRKIDAATYLHTGKLEEIVAEIAIIRPTLVIIDEEIPPAQQRNLEKQFHIPVMDRTELILEIFAARAQTKEAKLQIELAKTKYQFPRLKRLWSHFSRQRAKGGYLKGEGEKQIEIDRRLLKQKLEKLACQIEEVKKYRLTQTRLRREGMVPTIAIIGYTNAGKSTLLNALTEAKVLVEDKLFATLDPTTRKFILPNKQEVLLTDTVGFIRKLPHSLIAAFRSTLEAALQDDILLHLVDVSHPLAEEQATTTLNLLKELHTEPGSMITVLNKADLISDRRMIDRFRVLYPKTVVISALNKQGFEELLNLIMEQLANLRHEMKLKIPQSAYALVALLKKEGKILYEEYSDNDVLVRAMIPSRLVGKFTPYIYDS